MSIELTSAVAAVSPFAAAAVAVAVSGAATSSAVAQSDVAEYPMVAFRFPSSSAMQSGP